MIKRDSAKGFESLEDCDCTIYGTKSYPQIRLGKMSEGLWIKWSYWRFPNFFDVKIKTPL